jgi:hypothetical protein
MICGEKKVFAAAQDRMRHQPAVRSVRNLTSTAEGKMPDDQTLFLQTISQPVASLPPRNYIRMRAGAVVPWTPRRILASAWTLVQDTFAVFLPGLDKQ